MNLADGNLELAHRLPDRPRERAALVVELALLGDVVEIERVGIGLIPVRRAMAEDDHVAALAHGIDPFSLRQRAWPAGREQAERRRKNCQGQSSAVNHLVSPPVVACRTGRPPDDLPRDMTAYDCKS